MMKWTTLGILVLALWLSACQSAVDSADLANPAVATWVPTAPNGSDISVQQAESLILTGQVQQLVLGHSGKWALYLSDGKTVYHTISNSLRADGLNIDHVLQQCGQRCSGIRKGL